MNTRERVGYRTETGTFGGKMFLSRYKDAALRPYTSRPTNIEFCRSRAVGTRTPGTMLGMFPRPLNRRSEWTPSGGRAVGGDGGGIFSLQEHRGRQWGKCAAVPLPTLDGVLWMFESHSLVAYKQAATGNGEGEPAMSRNQTSWSTVVAVRIERKTMSDA